VPFKDQGLVLTPLIGLTRPVTAYPLGP